MQAAQEQNRKNAQIRRREGLRLLSESGYSVESVAAALDVTPGTVWRWQRAAAAESAEVAR